MVTAIVPPFYASVQDVAEGIMLPGCFSVEAEALSIWLAVDF